MRYCHEMDQFNVVSVIGKLTVTKSLIVFMELIQTVSVTESTYTTGFLRVGIVNGDSTIIQEKYC